MILYLDTSSLVKLYLEEAYSTIVRRWAHEAEILATCRVAYPEMLSALNRRHRSRDLVRSDYDSLIKAFSRDWPRYAVVDFNETTAGNLATRHGLRGFDAVHLSAALLVRESASRLVMAFSSFDEKLNAAALSEKLRIMRPKA